MFVQQHPQAFSDSLQTHLRIGLPLRGGKIKPKMRRARAAEHIRLWAGSRECECRPITRPSLRQNIEINSHRKTWLSLRREIFDR